MKKRTVILLALLSITLVIEACNLLSHGKEGKSSPQTNVTRQTEINRESLPDASKAAPETFEGYIGETRALEIALAHAGIDNSSLLFSKSSLEKEDGYVIYDVEFYADNKEYDYEIDAVSGNILVFDADMEYDFIPSTSQQPEKTPASNQSATITELQKNDSVQESGKTASSITLDAAKQIALGKVPGATDEHIRIKEDYDDGHLVYEGKIIYQQTEYEFEINAASGNITEWDSESIYD
ncbi:MAG: PepSY domain-containing protein [Lachnospiraceae bacterium]|nr:PepSY domain-containing protein [Lachnospiraceae bacterium]